MKPQSVCPFNAWLAASLGLYAACVVAAPLTPPTTAPTVPAAASLPAQPLTGTLFFTQAERQAMDKMRSDQPQSAVDGRPGAKAPGLINGVIKRSDGKDTVWVDGAPIAGGAGQAATSKMVGKPLHTVTGAIAPPSLQRAVKPSP